MSAFRRDALIIRSKEAAGRDKDRVTLPLLRALRDTLRRHQ